MKAKGEQQGGIQKAAGSNPKLLHTLTATLVVE